MLPDGTIAYAENPPKKYQDIYPINFDNDPEGICAEVVRILRLWISHGVRAFRVDNPHTKPLDFWERVLAEVSTADRDVIFLSEAFTRPAVLQGLAESASTSPTPTSPGATGPTSDLSARAVDGDRISCAELFVNTRDILHAYLQYGGLPRSRSCCARRHDVTGLGDLLGLRSSTSTSPYAGQRRYLDSEVPVQAAQLGSAGLLAPYLGQRDPPRSRPSTNCATCGSATRTTTRVFFDAVALPSSGRPRGQSAPSSQGFAAAGGASSGRKTSCWSWSISSARHPRGNRLVGHARARDGLARVVRRPR